MGEDVQSYGSNDAANISQVEIHTLEDQINNPSPIMPNTSLPAVISTTTILETTTEKIEADSSGRVLAYVLVPLGSLAIIILVSYLVVFILRKSRMDRLRHHLMPLYNFDPMEEEGDWESELLEEEKEQQVALNIRSPSERGPKLKFHTDV